MDLKSAGNKSLYLLALLLVLVVAVYSNSVGNSFHYDDFHMIVENTHIRNIKQIPQLFTNRESSSSSEAGRGNPRPLVMTSYAINYFLSGDDPSSYMMFNIAIHCGAIILLYIITLNLTGSSLISLLASAMFGLTPANNEIINYITARSGLLATLFYLAAFYCFMLFRKSQQEKTGKYKPAGYMLLFLFFTACSIMSKEIAITITMTVAVFDFYFTRSKMKENRLGFFFPYLFFIGIIVSYLVFRKFYTPAGAFFVNFFNLRFSDKLMLVPVLAVKHLLFFFLPYPLNVDHLFKREISLLGPTFIFSVLFIACFTLWLIFKSNKDENSRLLGFLSLWFFITLSPALILPLIVKAALFQENRGYLSYAGLSIFTCVLITSIMEKKGISLRKAAIFFLPVFFLFGTADFIRNRTWHDEQSLWEDALEKNPKSFFAHNSLGLVYHSRNELQRAIKAYESALYIDPTYYFAYNNIGKAYNELGEKDKSLESYRKALEIQPYFSTAQHNIGNIYLEKRMFKEAVKAYKKTLKINSTYYPAHLYMGIAYIYLNELPSALDEFRKVLQYAQVADAYGNIGAVQLKLGSMKPAEKNLQRALELKYEYPEAHLNLGMVYQQTRREQQAIKHLQIAEKQKDGYYKAIIGLAMLYSQQRNFNEALTYFQKFIDTAPQTPSTQQAIEFAREQVKNLNSRKMNNPG